MVSVERIKQYIEIEKEDLDKEDKKLDDDWPKYGEIIFDHVTFAYDKSLPNVLKDVSFRIDPMEKIGIVGRSGCGKSTIFQTLFRMGNFDGTVLVDGVNIKDISLHNLRSRLSIIPVICA
jgi:ABC-type multidrug transport system fused ATPase/permease subunit